MAQGISIREFARREGCSDTLVRRALKNARLTAFADRSLDPALVGSAWRESNAKRLNRVNSGANTSPDVRTLPDGARASLTPAVRDDEALPEAVDRLIESGIVGLVDYAEALRRKENYLALLRQLEYEQKSGTLVELDLARAILFEEFRAQRDAWLAWPARIGPLLAADLDLEADTVTGILTEHVHKQIESLGEPDGEFSRHEG